MKPAPAMTALTIRAMSPDDIESVHAIEVRIFPMPWSLTSYRFEMLNPISKKWVAEVEDAQGIKHIAGMIIVWLSTDVAYISNIGVDTAFRRQGIACKLLRIALVSCAQLGAQSAALEVRASNQAALALYDRFGFEQVGRHIGYYHDNNEDALRLTLHHLERDNIEKAACANEYYQGVN